MNPQDILRIETKSVREGNGSDLGEPIWTITVFLKDGSSQEMDLTTYYQLYGQCSVSKIELRVTHFKLVQRQTIEPFQYVPSDPHINHKNR